MLKKDITQYIDQHTSDESRLLSDLNRKTHLRMMYPRMLSGKVQGRFLEMVSRMIQPDRILEIGTFTGYSGLCLAAGLKKNGKLHTIEADPEIAEFAASYFASSEYTDKIVQHTGQALEIIPEIDEIFDLVFIDADKDNYLNYYQLVLPKVRAGGFIMADNALWDGKVARPDSHTDKETMGISAFNDYVQNDKQVENILVSIRDGIMLIRKL